MPEYPEVWTVINYLKKEIIGKIIISVVENHNKTLKNSNSMFLKKSVIKQKILDVKQYGKNIFIETQDFYLLLHLRMEGRLLYRKYSQENNINPNHMLITFKLNDGNLYFFDTRKFGTLEIYERVEWNFKKIIEKKNIGYEPYDSKCNAEYLLSRTIKKSIPIKQVLLDQTIISGIGNIYASEILFLSKIHPTQKAKTLNITNFNDIIKYTKYIFDESKSNFGTTVFSFKHSDGKEGLYQKYLYVYGRNNLNCKKCQNGRIFKIYLNKRGTYYCDICQKLK